MRYSITKIRERSKGAGGHLLQLLDRHDVFLALLILLVGFGGFGLGRFSKITETRESVRVIQSAASISADTEMRGQYVGSVNSDKYHLPWCSGAERIKEGNKIWFTTKKEAEAAGYVPAGNCKGI